MDFFREPQPGQPVRAVPGAGLRVPIWILGSSLFGAQVAAALGLPFSFASHFAPQLLHEAIAIYRERFTPSEHLQTAVRDARRERRRRRHRCRGAIPRLVRPAVVCQPARRAADPAAAAVEGMGARSGGRVGSDQPDARVVRRRAVDRSRADARRSSTRRRPTS